MLRVNSSNVLVVPPFECAWILDDSRQLRDNAGCVTFEAKGDNDVTLILKPTPGSKRWQHREHGGVSDLNQHYTVIFGSHQNSCLKIEKNSQECFRADKVQSISSTGFASCWVDYDCGKLTLGTGKPGSAPCYCWTDAEPIRDIQYIGLSSWDKHVCFQNICVRPPLAHKPATSSGMWEAQEGSSSCPQLTELCGRALIRHAEPGNVCAALPLVELLAPTLDEIASSLVGFLAKHLEETMRVDPEGFQALSACLLAELLGNPCLECRERRVFDAVMLWAYADPDPQPDQPLVRSVADVEALLLLIRFPLMPQEDLQSLMAHPFALGSHLLEVLLSEATQARMHQDAACEAEKPGAELVVEGRRLIRAVGQGSPGGGRRFQRRHAPASQHLMFVSSGDCNGVTHWLGTSYGTQEWVNPALSGMVEVQASSPCCKHTDPKAVVGKKFLRLNMAGRGRGGTWWLLDLKPDHRLICNFYTLQHDASPDYPSDWILQGSTDGSGWVDLRQHTDDSSLCMPQQRASWPVVSHAASLPYRMFRIILKGPNASLAGNRHTLHLSLIELYGHFFRLR